jgi:squalene synthase HpnC
MPSKPNSGAGPTGDIAPHPGAAEFVGSRRRDRNEGFARPGAARMRSDRDADLDPLSPYNRMTSAAFTVDLASYGPERCAARATPLAESRDYCRQLASTHYENFHVASALLPRSLRPHFHAVYAYCRWADDLADEIHDRARSLDLLRWWEDELRACYAGEARHPVFVALRESIAEFSIPIEPFADLLVAFRRDQQVERYETSDDVLDYCRYSANPVGRLVLYLARSFDDARAGLSDSICTGLQLANFCQDVASDFDRGRIYLPQETCRRFRYEAADFVGRAYNECFCNLMTVEVDRAEGYLRAGLPLVAQMPDGLRGDIWLFAQGGLAILDCIRRARYDVWRHRPKISRLGKVRLLCGALSHNFLRAPRPRPLRGA